MKSKKNLTHSEKAALIRYHGEALSRAFLGAPVSRRNEIVHHAERVLELAASIPAAEYGKE